MDEGKGSRLAGAGWRESAGKGLGRRDRGHLSAKGSGEYGVTGSGGRKFEKRLRADREGREGEKSRKRLQPFRGRKECGTPNPVIAEGVGHPIPPPSQSQGSSEHLKSLFR